MAGLACNSQAYNSARNILGYTGTWQSRQDVLDLPADVCYLCYPAIDKIVQDVGTQTTIFGLPIVKASWTIGESTKVFGYTESVIPILLTVFVLAYVERFLKKYVPNILQVVMVPGLSLLIMVPLTLCLLGPVGIVVGNVIQTV